MNKSRFFEYLCGVVFLMIVICFARLAMGGVLTVTVSGANGNLSVITTTNLPDTNSLNYYVLLASAPPNTNLETPIDFVGSAVTTSGGLLNMVWAVTTNIPSTNPPVTNFSTVLASHDMGATNTNTAAWSNTYISLFYQKFPQGTNTITVSCAVTHVYTTNIGTNTVTNSCIPGTNYWPEWTATLLPSWITRDGTFLNAANSNNAVWVGQQMNLASVTAGPWGESNHSWTMPSLAFKNYRPTSTNSNFTNLATSDLTNSNVSYYWLCAPAISIVTDSASVYGVPIQVEGLLNVQRPTASITAVIQSSSAVTTNYVDYPEGSFVPITGQPVLCFGLNVPNTNGIVFTETNSGSGSIGTNEWVQILNTNVNGDTLTNGFSFTNTNSGLDTQYPYGATTNNGTQAYDSPGLPLSVLPDSAVSCGFSATMYLMWKPSTNSAGTDSTVFIPLRSIGWSWGGAATNPTPPNSNTWMPVSGSFITPVNPTDTNVTNEVIWSNCINPNQ